jgi:hypothetical protein
MKGASRTKVFETYVGLEGTAAGRATGRTGREVVLVASRLSKMRQKLIQVCKNYEGK